MEKEDGPGRAMPMPMDGGDPFDLFGPMDGGDPFDMFYAGPVASPPRILRTWGNHEKTQLWKAWIQEKPKNKLVRAAEAETPLEACAPPPPKWCTAETFQAAAAAAAAKASYVQGLLAVAAPSREKGLEDVQRIYLTSVMQLRAAETVLRGGSPSIAAVDKLARRVLAEPPVDQWPLPCFVSASPVPVEILQLQWSMAGGAPRLLQLTVKDTSTGHVVEVPLPEEGTLLPPMTPHFLWSAARSPPFPTDLGLEVFVGLAPSMEETPVDGTTAMLERFRISNPTFPALHLDSWDPDTNVLVCHSYERADVVVVAGCGSLLKTVPVLEAPYWAMFAPHVPGVFKSSRARPLLRVCLAGKRLFWWPRPLFCRNNGWARSVKLETAGRGGSRLRGKLHKLAPEELTEVTATPGGEFMLVRTVTRVYVRHMTRPGWPLLFSVDAPHDSTLLLIGPHLFGLVDLVHELSVVNCSAPAQGPVHVPGGFGRRVTPNGKVEVRNMWGPVAVTPFWLTAVEFARRDDN